MKAHAVAVCGPTAGHHLLALSHRFGVGFADLDLLGALEGKVTNWVQRE